MPTRRAVRKAEAEDSKKLRLRTVGQMYDYTMEHKWSGKASAKTNYYNSMHVLNFCGRNEAISNMANGYWWNALKADVKTKRPGMSNCTLNKVITAGSTMLNFTREAGGHSVHMPDLKIKEKPTPQSVVWLKQEQVEKLARVASDFFEMPYLAKAILFSAYTMVRQSELLRLRAKDIDLEMGYIRIGGDPRRGLLNKGKEAGRTTVIHSRIREICQTMVNEADDPNEKVFGQHWLNSRGVPDGERLLRRFERVRRKCMLGDEVLWKSLRSTGATWYGRTMKPRELMAVGGWKDFEVVMKYCDVDNQAAMDAQASLPSPVNANPKAAASEPVVLPDGSIYLNGQIFRAA